MTSYCINFAFLNFGYELPDNSWSSLYNTEYTLRTLDYSGKKIYNSQ